MNREDFIFYYERDLSRLESEILAYKYEKDLWAVLPGTINSGGNLCQHLIGNLRTYIGLTLGGFAYVRDRDAEFSKRLFSKENLLSEVQMVRKMVGDSIGALSDQALEEQYPREVFDMAEKQNVGFVLMHLLAHLSYHTGQINYHRRWINSEAV